MKSKEIRHHMRGRLLEADWSSKHMDVKAPASGFPCGTCGVRDAIMCDVAPRRDSPKPFRSQLPCVDFGILDLIFFIAGGTQKTKLLVGFITPARSICRRCT